MALAPALSAFISTNDHSCAAPAPAAPQNYPPPHHSPQLGCSVLLRDGGDSRRLLPLSGRFRRWGEPGDDCYLERVGECGLPRLREARGFTLWRRSPHPRDAAGFALWCSPHLLPVARSTAIDDSTVKIHASFGFRASSRVSAIPPSRPHGTDTLLVHIKTQVISSESTGLKWERSVIPKAAFVLSG